MNQKKNRAEYSLLVIFISTTLFIISGCQDDTRFEQQDNNDDEKEEINILAYDGAWCWFSDPRAIYYSDNEIISGWVKKDGSVEVVKFNLDSEIKQLNTIYPKMQKDDHNNPAFCVLPNGNIFTMYAWHGGKKGVISNPPTVEKS